MQELDVIVTSVDNPEIFREITVHIIEPIDESSVDIFLNSGSYNVYDDENSKLTLTTSGAESNVNLNVSVVSYETLSIDYKILGVDDVLSNIGAINVDKTGNDFYIGANDIGKCELLLLIDFVDYDGLPTTYKSVVVEVVKVPEAVRVNGKSQDVNDFIYTYYQNNLGEPFTITVEDEIAYNRSFVITADNQYADVRLIDGSQVTFATVDNFKVSNNPTYLQSGQTVYISGSRPGTVTTLTVYAYGALEHNLYVTRTLTLSTMLGSTTIEQQKRQLNGEYSDVFYVEIGKSFELEYAVDDGASAYGVQLLQKDGTAINDFVSVEYTDGAMPVITVTGKKVGDIAVNLVLDNFVKSDTFVISVFAPLYADAIDNGEGIYFKTDSPEQNINIAEVNYGTNGKSLQSFVISAGGATQLTFTTNPTNANIYSLRYESLKSGAGTDASEYLRVSSSGSVVAVKKYADELTIKVTIFSLATNAYGDVILVESSRNIGVEIYIPMTNAVISQTSANLYWRQSLNPIQFQNADNYNLGLSINCQPSLVNLEHIDVEWSVNDTYLNLSKTDKLSAYVTTGLDGVSQENLPDSIVLNVTATIKYYSTIFVRRCIITVENPVRAKTLVAHTDDFDNKTAYFEMNDNEKLPNSITINSAVYSAEGIQNVTFDNICYRSQNDYVVTVDENGVIHPVNAGKTQIWVYAEDMQENASEISNIKIINVIVADGKTEDSAFRIINENDFEKIGLKTDSYFYFSKDISLKNQHFFPEFNGHIDGKGFSLTGILLNNEYQSLFGELGENSQIRDIVLTATFDFVASTSDVSLAGLSQITKGLLLNVGVNYLNSKLYLNEDVKNVSVAGITTENVGTMDNCLASFDLIVSSDDSVTLEKLYIGGLTAKNNGYMIGSNNNYEYRSYSTIQNYDFTGSIIIDDKITAEDSFVGGIVGENSGTVGRNNNSVFLGEGFAVKTEIVAKGIDNVGGIVGYNISNVNNSLVVAKIVANNNVGGVAGKNQRVENFDGSVKNAVVEMYEDVVTQGKFDEIVGNQNVGGIVGYAEGYTQNETTYNSSVSYAYIHSYFENSAVIGANYVGGIVGYAKLTTIEKSYANSIIGDDNAQIAGGIVGFADAVTVENSYSIVNSNAQTFGSVIGEAKIETDDEQNDICTSSIKKVYSTNSADFVAVGDATIENSYQDNLKQIETYENWNITADAQNISAFDWLISNNENDGYPTLVYDGYLMRKLQPSEIIVSIKDKFANEVVDGILLLQTNKLYALFDVLSITTDVTSRTSIYAWANVEDVLNTKNTSNTLSSRATIMSSSDQVVTFTFILANNKAITAQIQIAFVTLPTDISIKEVKINLNEIVKLSTSAVYDGETKVLSDTKIKLAIKNEDFVNTSSKNDFVILDGQTDIISGYTLFDGDARFKGLFGCDRSVGVQVYYIHQYEDLSGNIKTIKKQLPISTTLDLNVYSGASFMYITNSTFDMTLLDDITFTVTVDTDKTDDKLEIASNSKQIAFNANNNAKYITTNGFGAEENSVLILTPIEEALYDNKLTITFSLKFRDDYLDVNSGLKFKQQFNAMLEFTAQSNAEINGKVNITAEPQNLLKIDLTNYPAGSKTGTIFTRDNTAVANTLVPGQVGFLMVDIYPSYANYDQIQITSSSDALGNHISFIQLAQIEGENGDVFVELRPNTNIIENGIVLLPYSSTNLIDSTYNFNGRFYLNTLMGSNVPNDTLITITVKGITNVYNTDGTVDSAQEVIKTLEVIVKPAPELAISQNGDTYTETIAVDGQNKDFNLVYVGQKLGFTIELKNGLTATNLAINNLSGQGVFGQITSTVDATKNNFL